MSAIKSIIAGGSHADGLRLGATGEKLAFLGAAPIVRAASADQTAVTDDTGGSVADAVAAIVTAPTALTDSSGGTPASTIAAITNSANAGSADVAPVANAISQLTVNAIADRAAIVALTNGLAKNIELTNALRLALVNLGLITGAE